MKLNFAKLSPTQNMTIIVTDPVPRDLQAAVSARLMAYNSVYAEQVGFLEEPSLAGARSRLQMMGGEFCGNASMSMAAYLAWQDGLADGCTADIPLEVSGAEGVVNCRIERSGNTYLGTVNMPLPKSFGTFEGRPIVFFDGIAHIIVLDGQMTRAEAEAKIAGWCDLLQMEALGILLVNHNLSAFLPLVYVKETGSAVWERGCGSGTAAIGAYTALQGRGDLSLSQPGGTIRVQAQCDAGHIRRICITGRVQLAATGTAWIDL
ncbi:MAG: diaminopimelate epimerase [Clostridia bacterium]|nr:diaminopimelate epimerase [Clostridia bacterium]